MDDTISRQMAIDLADYTDYPGLAIEDVKKVTDEVVKGLKRLPSIDAVPVIRCKGCKHYMGNWYCDAWNNSPGFPAVQDDMFCSLAEGRES